MNSYEFPRIQILTIDDLLHQRVDAKIPLQTRAFKRAGRVKESSATLQTALPLVFFYDASHVTAPPKEL